MSILVQINNLKKSYGPHIILDGASFSVAEKQKIGVIGRNGAGKSTLFNIITGKEDADSGEATIYDCANLGYLKQEDDFGEADTVLSYLMTKSNKQEWTCAKIASSFELKQNLLDTRILDLSGGFQMRVKLALMLLKEPNLLLLDEPTNYLDLSTMLLLEKFLQSYNGAYLVISHDRRFIKNTCAETLDIENGKAYHYPGSLEPYLAFKKEKLINAEKYNKKQLDKQKHLQKFIDRFGAKASLASQAKSKAKQIGRLKTIDIENTLGSAVINIPKASTKKGLAFILEKIDIGYGSKAIAKNINLEIYKGEHLALLGDNGQGKSTFMKTLAGNLDTLGEPFKIAKNLRVAYYAQHSSASLNTKDTVESYLASQLGSGMESEDVYRMAGNFLFFDSDIKKPISVLSGGEKARLCLAGIFLNTHDVLLLDEPTNHLDFETAEALAMALAESNATIIFISHDRTFTSIISDNILEIKDGQLKRVFGDYDDYVYSLKEKFEKDNKREVEKVSEEKEIRKQKYKDDKEGKKKALGLEKKLEKLNNEKEKILRYFIENSSKPAPDKSIRLKELEAEIVKIEIEWLDLVGDF
jgi:ATP-binding cassette subfamily F protein 3